MTDLLLGIALVTFVVFTAALTLSRASPKAFPGRPRPRSRAVLWVAGALGVTLYVLGAVGALVRPDRF